MLLIISILGCTPSNIRNPPCGVSEGYFLTTKDDAIIHLHRHKSDGNPVLIVHGVSSNHYAWDLDEERSLGAYLVEQGYDAWLLDLRGHGDSREMLGGKRLKRRWSIDDYAMYDIPAAIDFILEKTGYSAVSYVGHSMGGIIAAMYLTQFDDHKITHLVAVGSPIDFSDPDPVMDIARTIFLGSTFPGRLDTQPFASIMGTLKTDFSTEDVEALVYNPDNMKDEAASRMFQSVVSPLWAGEMLQFARIIRSGRLISQNGDIDYRHLMSKITVPSLIIAGRADRIAPPDRVKDYALAVNGEFVLAGKENGFKEDYGHLDLVLGDNVRTEIYPIITSFISN